MVIFVIKELKQRCVASIHKFKVSLDGKVEELKKTASFIDVTALTI